MHLSVSTDSYKLLCTKRIPALCNTCSSCIYSPGSSKEEVVSEYSPCSSKRDVSKAVHIITVVCLVAVLAA